MEMETFHNRFPEVAKKETRCIIVRDEREGVQKGEYFLLESYCNDSRCDCRRVFINVVHNGTIMATIGYGREDIGFYMEWVGDDDIVVDVKCPILELCGFQSRLAPVLLEFVKKYALEDEAYVERLK